MTNATVKPALEKIQNDIQELKEMMQNGNGGPIKEETCASQVRQCQPEETKKELGKNNKKKSEEGDAEEI